MTRFDHYLTADHRACDTLLGTLRKHALDADWVAARAAFEALQHDVLAHFAAEEEILFPDFEARTGMHAGPTAVMRMEHDEARLLLEDLHDAVQARSLDDLRGHAEALLILLQQHNMKEEHILYPKCAEFAGSEADALSQRICARREAP